MPRPDPQLAEWIADRLRYRSLPDITGHTCDSASLKTLDHDIRACLAELIPDIGKPLDHDPLWIKQSLREHGVIDLAYEIPSEWLDDGYEAGLQLLDRLGFLMDEDEAEQFDYVASLIGDNLEDPTLLGELKADLDDQQTILRLLLMGGEAFPQTLSIVDACITNAASVWLHKHPNY
jgi:hypothetical protein